MGLSQSLYTGWTGMATHQRCMDNIGNNLANVNTTGFKKNDFMFTNLLNKVLTGGGLPTDGVRGTTNPMTVGVGVTTGTIATNQTQGPIESTGNPLDVAISGKGYFVVRTTYGQALTRNGSFYLDSAPSANQRSLLLGDGLHVQGWNAVNGVVTPSTTVTDITIPGIGDILAGKTTTSVGLTGVLPTNTSSSDFSGSATSNLQLKGNLPNGGKSLETHIFAPVTRTGDSPINGEMQDIKVRIDFTGPTTSADGTTSAYTWTMKTVDWPNPGDPEVQVYPAAGTSENTVRFYNQSNASLERAAGQAVDAALQPGGTIVSTTSGGVTTSFNVTSAFTLNVSRLTNLQNAPGGNTLETWSVDGNPKGTMARTVTVYDQYTEFVQTTDASGNLIMQAERRVDERPDTLYFRRDSTDNTGSHWTWTSSVDGQTGKLNFNTLGDLTSATGGAGRIAYDFSDVKNVNAEGNIQASKQNGYSDGVLEDITIDQDGKIYGYYSSGVQQVLAQIAMGTVPNTSGLESVAGTMFFPSPSSGKIMIGVAGDANTGGTNGLAAIGAGLLSPNCLEGSNVDLSQEFTTLITTQRGYQTNSKTVQTSDEMLQQLIAMKR